MVLGFLQVFGLAQLPTRLACAAADAKVQKAEI